MMGSPSAAAPAPRGTWFYPVAIAGVAALLLPKLWLADSALYRLWLTPQRLLFVCAIAKLGFLVAATVSTAGAARAFDRGNPALRGWTLMATGLGAFCAGQAILAWYQLVLRVPSPYPSAADPFFVAGMFLLAGALLTLLLAYTGAGLPLAGRREVVTTAALLLLPTLALAAWLLRPVLAQPAPLLEQALNIVYPLLDCVLLVTTLVLARTTARLRGGQLHRMWLVLLAGFLCTAAGDVLFSYFSTLGVESLDPLVDLLFAASYALWAWGVALQRQIGAARRRAPAPTVAPA